MYEFEDFSFDGLYDKKLCNLANVELIWSENVSELMEGFVSFTPL